MLSWCCLAVKDFELGALRFHLARGLQLQSRPWLPSCLYMPIFATLDSAQPPSPPASSHFALSKYWSDFVLVPRFWLGSHCPSNSGSHLNAVLPLWSPPCIWPLSGLFCYSFWINFHVWLVLQKHHLHKLFLEVLQLPEFPLPFVPQKLGDLLSPQPWPVPGTHPLPLATARCSQTSPSPRTSLSCLSSDGFSLTCSAFMKLLSFRFVLWLPLSLISSVSQEPLQSSTICCL